jgi:hypothetical protein
MFTVENSGDFYVLKTPNGKAFGWIINEKLYHAICFVFNLCPECVLLMLED